MKPAPSTLERETTLPVLERIEFGIGDPRALMMINAKQYSDITTAIMREYSTNAYDAHIMAGHTDPIEVSLPSLLDPFFVVRDHGVGMNRDIFRAIYTQFGNSDKRDSNDVNGQLGIGSKSGVAYTTQFTVTSVRDGIKTEAKVIREPDWTIVMDIITEDFTDEPNGTEIRIPVHNIDEFRHKASQFYKFWLPGRVLIDGKPGVHYVGEKIADNLYYSRDWNTSYVVLANVAYRIANPAALFANSKMSSLNFVAYVDEFKMEDGAAPIEFTPSREDLEYSERTKATLQSVISNFEADIVNTAQTEINAAKTHAEAYTAWAKWKDTLGGNLFGSLEFKGSKFQSDFPLIGKRYSMSKTYGGSAGIAINKWGVEESGKTVFVEDFHINVSAEVRRKVAAYIDLKWPDAKVSYYVFTGATNYDSVWVDWSKVMRVKWDDLKSALPKSVRNGRTYVPGSGRVPGSWDYFTRDDMKTEEPVPTDKTLLWIGTHDSKRTNESTILKMLDSDAVCLVVPGNRHAKLLRENPQIQSFLTWARAQVVLDGESLLSEDAKKTFGIDWSRQQWLNKLDISRVDDPELKKVKSLLENSTTLLKEYNRHKTLANYLHMMYNGFKEYTVKESDGGFFQKYPLLRSLSLHGVISDDVYLYINAKHKAESEKKK